MCRSHMMKELYPDHAKNSQKSTIRKQLSFLKEDNIWSRYNDEIKMKKCPTLLVTGGMKIKITSEKPFYTSWNVYYENYWVFQYW